MHIVSNLQRIQIFIYQQCLYMNNNNNNNNNNEDKHI